MWREALACTRNAIAVTKALLAPDHPWSARQAWAGDLALISIPLAALQAAGMVVAIADGLSLFLGAQKRHSSLVAWRSWADKLSTPHAPLVQRFLRDKSQEALSSMVLALALLVVGHCFFALVLATTEVAGFGVAVVATIPLLGALAVILVLMLMDVYTTLRRIRRLHRLAAMLLRKSLPSTPPPSDPYDADVISKLTSTPPILSPSEPPPSPWEGACSPAARRAVEEAVAGAVKATAGGGGKGTYDVEEARASYRKELRRLRMKLVWTCTSLLLNVIAFLGYMFIVVGFFTPSPWPLVDLTRYFGLPWPAAGELMWGGSLVGDVAWTVEPGLGMLSVPARAAVEAWGSAAREAEVARKKKEA